ncbi:uncharacterized protein RCC_07500 [Ramularia collo-cygni]|uniref:SnoaL-like domain-containing protein n=1 Tax=Ramularia collo-cygni TaxID=112498 RepID=A0A2D3V4M3_9PEZI|nr:uncharacterized protein RCC_07500 [Ramularia collo-cygni]CZT21635.1 uncharacterized protein RCC_07500 [Ramularia collo-cygni]
MALALNARDLDRNSPAWRYLAPHFLAGPIPPAIQKKIGVDEYLQHLSDMCTAYPEWKLRVVDQDVQQGGVKDYASVFTNVENQGVPPGVVWQSCAISEFKNIDGQWLVVGFRGFSGGHGQGTMF